MRERDPHASKPSWTVRPSVRTGLAVLLGAALVVAFGQVNALPNLLAPENRALAEGDLPTLFERYRCPCCDENIGECTCQQAADRRLLLSERVTLGDTRRDIDEFMLLHDGPGAFFDAAAAGQAQLWLEDKLPDARPTLVLDQEAIDLGTVRMVDGLVSARFVLRNGGRAPLVITDINTSCMCTSASLETAAGRGPVFSYHGDKPEGWSATLASGEEATLIVTFDPNAHGPDAVGQFMREVSVTSNDPLRRQSTVRITVNVEP